MLWPPDTNLLRHCLPPLYYSSARWCVVSLEGEEMAVKISAVCPLAEAEEDTSCAFNNDIRGFWGGKCKSLNWIAIASCLSWRLFVFDWPCSFWGGGSPSLTVYHSLLLSTLSTTLWFANVTLTPSLTSLSAPVWIDNRSDCSYIDPSQITIIFDSQITEQQEGVAARLPNITDLFGTN